MKVNSKIPYIILSSESLHQYLIPEKDSLKFREWDAEMENFGDSDDDFNQYQIDSVNSIKIYQWEVV